ncbi:hypothetical protein [Maribellus sediminis]|uniref:hypothetical protein n=1 Tax=Maribellus sediminis TaxID=2696285 RepID=UPI00142F5AB7|nr:hypothetical protein [Maribellus sediminis]
MKKSKEFFGVSQVEDLHNFYCVERNLQRAIMRMEWAISNLDDVLNGRNDKVIDIEFFKELSTFFDWIRFDRSSQSFYNKSVLQGLLLGIAVWFDFDDLNPDEIDNVDARDQIRLLSKIYPVISKWIKENYDSEERKNQPCYYLYTEINKSSVQLKKLPSTSYPEIFSDGGYDLFSYLNNNYNSENKSPKAKYSVLYHYLKYEQFIVGSQLEYIRFIKNKFGVSLSKIQRTPLKYDSIRSSLGKLKGTYSAFNMK